MKKRLLPCLLMCALVLSACGKEEASEKQNISIPAALAEEIPTEETSNPIPSKPIPSKPIVKYAYCIEDVRSDIEECKEEFEADNPEIEILLVPLDRDTYETKMGKILVNAGIRTEEEMGVSGKTSRADVYLLEDKYFGDFACNGLLSSMNVFSGATSVTVDGIPEAINDSFSVDGKLYGIPCSYCVTGLWYNKALFDEAGVSYPDGSWTWADFVSTCYQLTDSLESAYAITLTDDLTKTVYNTVRALDGSIREEGTGTPCLANENTKLAFQCFVDLQEVGYAPEFSLTQIRNASKRFLSGESAMVFEKNTFAGAIAMQPDMAEYVDYTYFPLMNGNRALAVSGNGNGIAADTCFPEESWKWVKFLASKGIETATGNSEIDTEEENTAFGVFEDEAFNYGYAYPKFSDSTEFDKELQKQFGAMLNREISVEDACSEIELSWKDTH